MGTALLLLVAWLAIGFATAVGIQAFGWFEDSDVPDPPQSITIIMWPIVYIVIMAHFFATFFENNIPNLVDVCASWIKKPQDEPKKEQDQLKQNDLK